MTKGRWMVAVAAVAWLAAGSGCVSLDRYRQLKMDNNKLAGEKAHIEQELYDARNNNESMRTKLTSCEDQLRTKEALASNLQSENNRLADAVRRAQDLLEKMANQPAPSDIVVVETKLPPELDTALKDFASQFPDSVYYDPDRGVVKWTSDLLFALGSDVVKQSAKDSLRSFSQIMSSSKAAGFEVLVVGHTDNVRIGAQTAKVHPTNWHLSAHRAISVGTVLQDNGVAPDRIGVMGFGEYRPIASNETDTGRAQNRRVEIYVVPVGSVAGVKLPARSTGGGTQVVDPLANPEDDGIK